MDHILNTLASTWRDFLAFMVGCGVFLKSFLKEGTYIRDAVLGKEVLLPASYWRFTLFYPMDVDSIPRVFRSHFCPLFWMTNVLAIIWFFVFPVYLSWLILSRTVCFLGNMLVPVGDTISEWSETYEYESNRKRYQRTTGLNWLPPEAKFTSEDMKALERWKTRTALVLETDLQLKKFLEDALELFLLRRLDNAPTVNKELAEFETFGRADAIFLASHLTQLILESDCSLAEMLEKRKELVDGYHPNDEEIVTNALLYLRDELLDQSIPTSAIISRYKEEEETESESEDQEVADAVQEFLDETTQKSGEATEEEESEEPKVEKTKEEIEQEEELSEAAREEALSAFVADKWAEGVERLVRLLAYVGITFDAEKRSYIWNLERINSLIKEDPGLFDPEGCYDADTRRLNSVLIYRSNMSYVKELDFTKAYYTALTERDRIEADNQEAERRQAARKEELKKIREAALKARQERFAWMLKLVPYIEKTTKFLVLIVLGSLFLTGLVFVAPYLWNFALALVAFGLVAVDWCWLFLTHLEWLRIGKITLGAIAALAVGSVFAYYFSHVLIEVVNFVEKMLPQETQEKVKKEFPPYSSVENGFGKFIVFFGSMFCFLIVLGAMKVFKPFGVLFGYIGVLFSTIGTLIATPFYFIVMMYKNNCPAITISKDDD